MSGSIVIGGNPNRCATSYGSRASRGRSRAATRGTCGALLESPRPARALVGGVLRQALVVERLHVVLVPTGGFVVAEQHLLLAGGEVVPRLCADLVRGGQVVLLLLRAVHVGAVAGGLHGLVAGGLVATHADTAAPHLIRLGGVGLRRVARDLLLHGAEIGGLGCVAGGGAAAGGVLAHGCGVQVAHALRGAAQHLLVLGPVGRAAQVGEQLEVLLRVLLLQLRLLRLEHLLLVVLLPLLLLHGLGHVLAHALRHPAGHLTGLGGARPPLALGGLHGLVVAHHRARRSRVLLQLGDARRDVLLAGERGRLVVARQLGGLLGVLHRLLLLLQRPGALVGIGAWGVVLAVLPRGVVGLLPLLLLGLERLGAHGRLAALAVPLPELTGVPLLLGVVPDAVPLARLGGLVELLLPLELGLLKSLVAAGTGRRGLPVLLLGGLLRPGADVGRLAEVGVDAVRVVGVHALPPWDALPLADVGAPGTGAVPLRPATLERVVEGEIHARLPGRWITWLVAGLLGELVTQAGGSAVLLVRSARATVVELERPPTGAGVEVGAHGRIGERGLVGVVQQVAAPLEVGHAGGDVRVDAATGRRLADVGLDLTRLRRGVLRGILLRLLLVQLLGVCRGSLGGGEHPQVTAGVVVLVDGLLIGEDAAVVADCWHQHLAPLLVTEGHRTHGTDRAIGIPHHRTVVQVDVACC